MRRLRAYGTVPDELLFVPQGPRDGEASHLRAYDQVRRDLDEDGVNHVAAEATPEIVAFANKAE